MRARPVLIAAVAAAALLGAGYSLLSVARGPDGPIYRPEIEPLGWSADGERVLFVHTELYGGYDHIDDRGCGASGIYETDGRSPPRPVLVGETWCAGAAGWRTKASLSTDGRTVFTAPERGYDDCTGIAALHLAERRWTEVARFCGSHLYETAVSPDGRRIVTEVACGFATGGGRPSHVTPRGCADTDGTRFTVMNLDGSGRRVVGEAGDRDPVWSPDGRRLAVMTEGEWNIVVIDLETGTRRTVTQGHGPVWSPDGQWLAFTRHPGKRDARVTLHVIRADGTGERVVFTQQRRDMRRGPQYPSPGGWPRDPIWSPDGRRIVFTKHFQRGNTLWVVNADGTGLRRLSERIEPAD
jgi:Tol biopolymer transport system component